MLLLHTYLTAFTETGQRYSGNLYSTRFRDWTLEERPSSDQINEKSSIEWHENVRQPAVENRRSKRQTAAQQISLFNEYLSDELVGNLGENMVGIERRDRRRKRQASQSPFAYDVNFADSPQLAGMFICGSAFWRRRSYI